MASYKIGQIIEGEVPEEAIHWCNMHFAYLDEIEPSKFEIKQQEPYKPTTEEINNFTMTPLDFINVLQRFGLTLEQINAYLESNLSVKMQLTYCNNVYCGVAKSLMPIEYGDITITAKMVENAFKAKYGVQ